MLIDQVEIELQAGRGGDGVVSWRREKFVPKGGPDGGDGGRGGSIYILVNHNLDSLTNYRYRKNFQAEDGSPGQSRKRTGKGGDDLELIVPVGTKIIELGTGRMIADLTKNDDRFLIAKGGKGGFGNIHFVSSTNQNPFQANLGRPGEKLTVQLELQLVADFALIGLPNAGKSSLLHALTGREVPIGAYAFSTTEPYLAVVKKGRDSLTLVDLPGLIEGASLGKGLGDEFLRHTNRVKGLVQIVDATDPDLPKSIKTILEELRSFNDQLLGRPKLLILNKSDCLDRVSRQKIEKKYPDGILVSAKTGENLNQLVSGLFELREGLDT